MRVLEAYQLVLLTILAVSSTGLLVLRYREHRAWRRWRDERARSDSEGPD